MSGLRLLNAVNRTLNACRPGFGSPRGYASTCWIAAQPTKSWPNTTAFHRLQVSCLSHPGFINHAGISVIPVRYAWFTKSRKGPKMPPTKHLDFDHSGDLVQSLPELDLSEPRLGYEKCAELETADDEIKKIFSLEFGTGRDRKAYHVAQFVSQVNRRQGDYRSMEAKIAKLTVKIRTQIQYCLAFRKNKVAKCSLNENIQMRTKLLKRLRQTDWAKFEALCEQLRIIYLPVPEEPEPKTKRYKAIKAAEAEAEAVRLAKLRALERDLAEQRAAFYAEKSQTMADIERDLAAMAVDGRQMMQDLERAERKEERWRHSKFYKFLHKFPAVNNKYITMKVEQ